MRHIATPLLILAVVLTVVSSAAGQWDRRNAATWYRQVVEHSGWQYYGANRTIPDSERLLTDAEYELIIDYEAGSSGEPSPQLRQALAKARPLLDLIRRGSQQNYSDFQLDYSQGFELLLPHIQSLRSAARVMYADAQVRLHDGDIAGATDRMASLYRLSGHIGADRVLISSLVGSSLFAFTDGMTQQALDRGDLSAFESAILVNALKNLDARDPFNYIEAVTGEQVIAVDWMAQRFSTQEDRQKYHDEIGPIFGNEEFDRYFLEATDEEFAGELAQYDNYMSRAIEAFMMDDPEEGRAALTQLEEEAKAGEHGLFASFLAPAFSRVLDRMHQSRAMLAERLAELEKLAQGEIKPEEYANGAVFYERGIKRLREIEDGCLQNALDYQAGAVEESSEAIIKTLTDAQSVVDLFREGSEKRRCDFAYLRQSSTDQFCPDYLAGMRDALRLILADTMRLLEAGEADAATDRLATCYRAVAHLTDDELILSALVAHRTFEETHVLGRRFQKSDAWTETHRETLLKAVERIGRKDPFGYISSIMATRDRLAKSLWNLPSKAEVEEGKPTREKATELIKALNGDQLLSLAAARDVVIEAATAARIAAHLAKTATPSDAQEQEKPDDKAHPLTRMEGIIDFEALVAVRDEAEAIDTLFNAGRVDEIFSTSAFPRVAPVLQWMSRARADLRDCIIRLRPPMAEPQVPAEPPD